MRRISRAAVRLAARALPRGIRNRYREEWLGDLDSAGAEGIRASGIAVGALLFSATLNRDAPQVSGVPLTVMTRRHARWGLALLGASGVIAIGYWVNGDFAPQDSRGGLVAARLAGVHKATPAVAIASAALGVVFLWRAAMLASGLAKISAALASLAVLAVVVPLPGGVLPPVVAGALVASGICGLIAWTAAPAASSPSAIPAIAASAVSAAIPAIAASAVSAVSAVSAAIPASAAIPVAIAPTPTPRRLGAVPIAVIVTLALIGAVGAILLSGVIILLLVASVVAAMMIVIVVALTRSHRRTWPTGERSRASRRASITVGCFSALLLGLVVVGSIELIVWSPQWMAPGYTLAEIYAALSEVDRVSGLVEIIIWIVIWSGVSLAYLAAGLMITSRPGHPSAGTMAVVGLAMISAMVFFQFWAGFSIGNSISDTLPPFTGGRSEFGSLYAVAGQVALIVALVAVISPPPRRGVRVAEAASA